MISDYCDLTIIFLSLFLESKKRVKKSKDESKSGCSSKKTQTEKPLQNFVFIDLYVLFKKVIRKQMLKHFKFIFAVNIYFTVKF